MVSFSVPIKHGCSRFRFSVQEPGVLFAGARHQEVPQSICKALIQGLAGDGFSFWVGCANGVDRSFRKSLSESAYTDRVFVGCAFRRRAYHPKQRFADFKFSSEAMCFQNKALLDVLSFKYAACA